MFPEYCSPGFLLMNMNAKLHKNHIVDDFFKGEWALLPQTYIDTLLVSITALYEASLNVHSDHTRYKIHFFENKCFISGS